MPDHVHVLVEGESQTADLKKFVSAFKQKSGYWFRQMQKQATLKGCPTKDEIEINVGQGFRQAQSRRFSLAKSATLKGCPTKEGKNVNGQGLSLAKMRGDELWQINYYDHVLRSDEATEKVARYILENPVRKGLVEDFRNYPFSWCQVFDFVGQGFSLADHATLKGCPTKDVKATLKGCPTKHKKNEVGFTLIEIVMTIVIVSIIAGVSGMIIASGVRAYSDEQARSDVHYQARLAMERMTREIRTMRGRAAAPDDIPNMAANALGFYDITGVLVEFDLSGTNLRRQQDGGGWQTLATNIAGPLFEYYDNAGNPGAAQNALWYVEIGLTATQGSESLQMNTRVHPRNF